MNEPKFPYRAVADDLRAKIASGKIKGKLPTRVQLAEQYAVSDMTIGSAIRVLKDEGLLTSVPGLGVYVSE
jgi:DNA-binding GntR family transcriptional regulator